MIISLEGQEYTFWRYDRSLKFVNPGRVASITRMKLKTHLTEKKTLRFLCSLLPHMTLAKTDDGQRVLEARQWLSAGTAPHLYEVTSFVAGRKPSADNDTSEIFFLLFMYTAERPAAGP